MLLVSAVLTAAHCCVPTYPGKQGMDVIVGAYMLLKDKFQYGAAEGVPNAVMVTAKRFAIPNDYINETTLDVDICIVHLSEEVKSIALAPIGSDSPNLVASRHMVQALHTRPFSIICTLAFIAQRQCQGKQLIGQCVKT